MRLLLPLVMLLLTACQSQPLLPTWQSPEGREHPDLGRIVDLRSGEHISPKRLIDELAKVDQVLVGERHDNPDHHALQLWLLQALAQHRAQGSLLLEMLNPDQQDDVAQVQALIDLGEWPADLAAALDWQNGWEWKQYAPVVRHALAQPYPLMSANLDRAEIMRVYRRIPTLTGAPADNEVQRTLLEQIRISHCDMLPETQLPAMLAVQQQRDQRMADQLDAAPKPAMLLAGAFHVRRDLGVPLHLESHDGRVTTRVLILAEVEDVVRAGQADFVWYTPAQPQQDHCAGLRKVTE
ncbi:MAG: ChaN family lipoprotein [Gammaproteobacteria bacterium]|nr:ChaN family lipoprotein [Gammaproteobacteria bacterium]MBU1460706.1 ChaN family lipoprotein [Gammaproteobacteria bacterium]MBU2372995.1 ChaN family lipoprotein [Gammaproteobacteria bacterium]